MISGQQFSQLIADLDSTRFLRAWSSPPITIPATYHNAPTWRDQLSTTRRSRLSLDTLPVECSHRKLAFNRRRKMRRTMEAVARGIESEMEKRSVSLLTKGPR